MSQPPQPPQIGEVVNGYQWNGAQWVPLPPPQVGQVVNGHRWDGQRWVPLAPPAPQVGQVANGHRWDGQRWVPLAPPAPQVGQVANGHRWDGQRWVPLAPPAPQVGQVANGHRWDGQRWVPLAPPAPPVAAQPPPQAWQQYAASPDGTAAQTPAAPAGLSGPTGDNPPPAPAAVPPSPAGRPAPAVLDELKLLADAWQFSWQVKGDLVTMSRVIAERKAFLSTARLEYVARIRLDEARRGLRFSEQLKESGVGLSSGGDDNLPGGFSAQRTSFNTRTDGIAETIEQEAARFGASYPHDFPYALVREQVAGLAQAQGYRFDYGLG